MKNALLKTLFSLLAVSVFWASAFSQNANRVKILAEKGPNGGDVQVVNEKYNVEMKRNASSIELYILDEQKQALTAENDLSGAVVVAYSDQTEKSYILEPGFNLADIALESEGPIFMVMLSANYNGEYFEARYYLKEGDLEQQHDMRVLEMEKRKLKVNE